MRGPKIPITIRPEASGDEATIHEMTTVAFEPMPFSDGSEPDLIDRLRVSGDLTLSLVAEDAERIVGHIAFSPVTIGDNAKDWYGLGPVSVWPEIQQRGIGGALIKRGIADMRAMGAKGIVLLGSNVYYPRFGFVHEPQLTYAGAPPEFFQCLLLDGGLPCGEVKFSPAFG
ncbi:GNAT family N-acetyltransferase [Erythrobacter crassostreae]|uniref:N-acetyltransferase n=1 Tax=Erythrobacter crassostreae TaxID=2828328 RepID=A0A9X1F276_9SPHN|nr:N-acetyltransferase [Erythrobacter crassostrea]MBV7258779.1 N-acetyltransferase [Erythrobacter crassostrea]